MAWPGVPQGPAVSWRTFMQTCDSFHKLEPLHSRTPAFGDLSWDSAGAQKDSPARGCRLQLPTRGAGRTASSHLPGPAAGLGFLQTMIPEQDSQPHDPCLWFSPHPRDGPAPPHPCGLTGGQAHVWGCCGRERSSCCAPKCPCPSSFEQSGRLLTSPVNSCFPATAQLVLNIN